MAIIAVHLPGGAAGVRYGSAKLLADGGAVDVPAYVAKTIAGIEGTTAPGLPDGSASDLLAATTEAFEANYIFQAFGLTPPTEDAIAKAVALFGSKGEPAAALL